MDTTTSSSCARSSSSARTPNSRVPRAGLSRCVTASRSSPSINATTSTKRAIQTPTTRSLPPTGCSKVTRDLSPSSPPLLPSPPYPKLESRRSSACTTQLSSTSAVSDRISSSVSARPDRSCSRTTRDPSISSLLLSSSNLFLPPMPSHLKLNLHLHLPMPQRPPQILPLPPLHCRQQSDTFSRPSVPHLSALPRLLQLQNVGFRHPSLGSQIPFSRDRSSHPPTISQHLQRRLQGAGCRSDPGWDNPGGVHDQCHSRAQCILNPFHQTTARLQNLLHPRPDPPAKEGQNMAAV